MMDPFLLLLQNLAGDESQSPCCRRNPTVDVRVEKAKSLLEWLTQWNFAKIKSLLLQTLTGGTPSVLKSLVSCIFDMALASENYVLFGRLCAELYRDLAPVPSEESYGQYITFQKLLMDKCRIEFENATSQTEGSLDHDEEALRVRLVGTVRLKAELFKLGIVSDSICQNIIRVLLEPTCPPERNIEAIYQFVSSVEKHVDLSSTSWQLFDAHLEKLRELTQSTQLTTQSKVIISNLQHFLVRTATARSVPGADENQEPLDGAASMSSDNTSGDAGEEESESSEEGDLLDVDAIKAAAGEAESEGNEKLKRRRKTEGVDTSDREELELVKQQLATCQADLDSIRKELDESLKLTYDILDKQQEDKTTLPSPSRSGGGTPKAFKCPISLEVMKDPLVTADGHSYEGEIIRQWIKEGHETSPRTNLKLYHTGLVPNHALRSAIQEFLGRG